jgi:hypothetical protein
LRHHIKHPPVMANNTCKIDHDRSINEGHLLGEQWTLSAISFFPFKEFSWISVPNVQPHDIQHLWGWSRWVYNEGYFACRTLYLFGCIFSSIHGIFLKLHILHSFPMVSKTCMFFAISIEESAFYIKNTVPSQLYLFLHSRDFPETPHRALSSHELQYL